MDYFKIVRDSSKDYTKVRKSRSDKLVEQAQALVKRKEYEQASRLLDKIPQDHNQTDEVILGQRAKLYQLLSRADDAFCDAKFMIKKWPNEPRGYRLMAKLYQSKGNDAYAQYFLNKAMLQCPPNASYYQYTRLKQEEHELTKRLKAQKKTDPFGVLGWEIRLMILKYLPFKQVVQSLGISRLWNALLKNDSHHLWLDLDMWNPDPEPTFKEIQGLAQYCNNNVTRLCISPVVDVDISKKLAKMVTNMKNLRTLDLTLHCEEERVAELGGIVKVGAKLGSIERLQALIVRGKLALPAYDIRTILKDCKDLKYLRVDLVRTVLLSDNGKKMKSPTSGHIGSSLKSLTLTFDSRSSGLLNDFNRLCAGAPMLEILRVRDTEPRSDNHNISDGPYRRRTGTQLRVLLEQFPKLRVLSLRSVMLRPFRLPSTIEELEIVGDAAFFNTKDDSTWINTQDLPKMANPVGLPNLKCLKLRMSTVGVVIPNLARQLLSTNYARSPSKLDTLYLGRISNRSAAFVDVTDLLKHPRLTNLRSFGMHGLVKWLGGTLDDIPLTVRQQYINAGHSDKICSLPFPHLTELYLHLTELPVSRFDAIIESVPELKVLHLGGDCAGLLGRCADELRRRGIDVYCKEIHTNADVAHYSIEEEREALGRYRLCETSSLMDLD